MNKSIWVLLLTLLLNGCSDAIDRLKRVGNHPEFARLKVPSQAEQIAPEVVDPKYQEHVKKTNSLWQPGATTFFRDNRAWRVGDILKVVIQIRDSARLDNSTGQQRKGGDSVDITSFFGKEKAIATFLSKKGKTKPLASTKSDRKHEGSGKISRKEDIQTEVAVTVVQVLQNGNLVIQGHQEIRVNYELREIKLAGIIRPQDIRADNSVNSDQIAEARISYGGRGVVSDVQQPRVGSQIIDIISPF